MLLSFLSCGVPSGVEKDNRVSTMHIWGSSHCGSISSGSVSSTRESVQGQSCQTLLAYGNIACDPELVSCTPYTDLPICKAFSSSVQVNPRQASKLTECFVNRDAQNAQQLVSRVSVHSETSMVSFGEQKRAMQ